MTEALQYRFQDIHEAMDIHILDTGHVSIKITSTSTEPVEYNFNITAEQVQALFYQFPLRAFQQAPEDHRAPCRLGFGEDVSHLKAVYPSAPVYARFFEAFDELVHTQINRHIMGLSFGDIPMEPSTNQKFRDQKPSKHTVFSDGRVSYPYVILGAFILLMGQALVVVIGVVMFQSIGPFDGVVGMVGFGLLLFLLELVAYFFGGICIGHLTAGRDAGTHAKWSLAIVVIVVFLTVGLSDVFHIWALFGWFIALFVTISGAVVGENKKLEAEDT